jgi:hypothetical protein
MGINLCPGSGKPIGQLPLAAGTKIVCEVCGQECKVSPPTPKAKRAGVQSTYSSHLAKDLEK